MSTAAKSSKVVSGERRVGHYAPMSNIASRSCFEKTSNATIVWVRVTPGQLDDAAR